MDESSRNSVKIAQLVTVVSRRHISTVQFFMFMGVFNIVEFPLIVIVEISLQLHQALWVLLQKQLTLYVGCDK